jgi:hypothetical protein
MEADPAIDCAGMALLRLDAAPDQNGAEPLHDVENV